MGNEHTREIELIAKNIIHKQFSHKKNYKINKTTTNYFFLTKSRATVEECIIESVFTTRYVEYIHKVMLGHISLLPKTKQLCIPPQSSV